MYLIVSASEKGGIFFSENFHDGEVCIVDSAKGVRASDYSIIIVDAPLSDEFGIDFAVKCAESVPTVLFVKKERYEQAAAYAEPLGVIVVEKPVSAKTIKYIIKTIDILENRNKELVTKLEDIKLINRAKLLLISNLKMTESQAHRHIEHQAMNRRVAKREIAMSILMTYDESMYNK